ncbi:MAG: hypothetical protein WC412_04685 [Candidatus Omnitrophota bacterium]|jgi:Tfp pilus assembly protein PilV
MNIYLHKQKSLTLAEILIAVCILIVAVSAILMAYANCFILIDSVRNVNIATNAAQGVIEEIRNTAFTRLTDPSYCDCVTSLCNGCTFTVNEIPQSMGVIYIDETTPELLGVTVSVCWRQKGRTIGEDSNLNGILDAGEDTNVNGRIDSTVELTTKVANRF